MALLVDNLSHDGWICFVLVLIFFIGKLHKHPVILDPDLLYVKWQVETRWERFACIPQIEFIDTSLSICMEI